MNWLKVLFLSAVELSEFVMTVMTRIKVVLAMYFAAKGIVKRFYKDLNVLKSSWRVDRAGIDIVELASN